MLNMDVVCNDWGQVYGFAMLFHLPAVSFGRHTIPALMFLLNGVLYACPVPRLGAVEATAALLC
jgi:hypothetical protein